MPRWGTKHSRRGGVGALLVLLLIVLPLVEAEREDKQGPKEKTHGEGHRRAGHFEDRSGQFVGRFVDFYLDRGSCTMADVRVGGVEFLDMIDLRGPCDGAAEAEGYRVEVEVADARVMLHDNPTGLIRIEAGTEHPVKLWIAAGVSAQITANGELRLRAGNETARLLITAPAERPVRLASDRTVLLEDVRATFVLAPRENPPASPAAPGRSTVPSSATEVGARVEVLRDESGVVREEVLPFQEVVIARLDSQPHQYRFVVEGKASSARTIELRFAPGTLPEGGVALNFYDAHEGGWRQAPIEAAPDLETLSQSAEVVDGSAKFWTDTSDSGTRVLVSLPKVQSHLLEILALLAGRPVLIGGALGGILFVAWAARGLVRRSPRGVEI